MGKQKNRVGYIYVLSNPLFRFLKIGYTTNDPWERCRQLSCKAYIPEPYKVEYTAKLNRCQESERRLHDMLDGYRHGEREFFDITVTEAVDIIKYNLKIKHPNDDINRIRAIYQQAATHHVEAA